MSGVRIAAEAPHNQLAALTALLEGCTNPGVTRRVLVVNVTELPPALRRPHHLRLIEAALDPLLSLDRAALHRLADGSLIATWRGEDRGGLAATLAALRRLFTDVAEPPIRVLDLPRDTTALAQRIAASLPRAQAASRPPFRVLDPGLLAALEAALAQADITPFIRRKPICDCAGDTPFRLKWDKRSVSLGALAAVLAPGVPVEADPWLYPRLTRSFDRRMLAALADPRELRDAGPFALDLNMCSIVEPEFLRFDRALPGGLRGKVVLAVPAADALTDPATFAFARDFARARGYLLSLRGVSPAALALFPPDRLGMDYVFLDMAGDTDPAPPPALAPRLVLCGVNDEAAIARGRRWGISLFEGPAVRPDPSLRRPLVLRRSSSRRG